MNVITKTRGDVPPFGKPRVVICPHGLYRGGEAKLAEDLLEAADVAVSYLAGWHVPEGAELDRYLEGARLAVSLVDRERLVPIALNQETFFRAVAARGIPILPILRHDCMGDEECAKNYRRLLGNRQYVSSWLGEYTAELREYLSALMADEDTRRTVAGAFRGRLFLSYRKKDGDEAAKLMHLLHNLPGMEDVGIWIDDYLTPGEDFSDEIREALVSSNAVILCVTPNLLEMDNYVMRVEYPEARKQGIPVLPVFMAEDSRVLRDKTFREIFESSLRLGYPDIEARGTFRPDRLAELCRALEEILPPPEEWSAEKTYLLGLGYFYGIEVEEDKSRALGLFRKAAKMGEPRAAEKLSELFEGKLGIGASETEQIHYLRLAADLREAALLARETGDAEAENVKVALRARRHLANLLFRRREIAESLAESERAFSLAQRVLPEGKALGFCRAELAFARARNGRLRGALSEALSHAEESVRLWQSLLEEEWNISHRQGLGGALLEKAGILQKMGKSRDAVPLAEEAHALFSSAAEDNNHTDQEYTLHALGVLYDLYDASDNQERAEDCARRLAREAEVLYLQSPSSYRRELLCRGLQGIGRCDLRAGRCGEGVASYRRVYDLLQATSDASADEICEATRQLATALLWDGKLDEAISRLDEAALWTNRIPGEAEDSLRRLDILSSKCAALFRLGRREEAEACLAEGLSAYRRRAEKTNDASTACELAYLLRVGAENSEDGEAIELYAEAATRLAPFLGKNLRVEMEYIRSVNGRVVHLYRMERWEECRSETEEALSRIAPCAHIPDVKAQSLKLYCNLGDLGYRQKDGGEAPLALRAYRTVLASAEKARKQGIKVPLVAARVHELALAAKDTAALLLALPHLEGTAKELAERSEQARDLLWEAGKKREAIRCALTAIDHREIVFRRTMAEEARAKLAQARAWHADHSAPTAVTPRPQTAPKPPSAKKPPKKKGFWARLFGKK